MTTTFLRRTTGLSVFLALSLLRTHAAIKTWDGSSSGLWSTGANWSGGTRPQNGDELHFPQGVTRRTMTNDITNLQVTFIFFEDNDANNYILRGNPLTVGGASSGGSGGGVESRHTNGVNRIECDINLLRSDLGGAQNFLFVFPGTGSLIFSGGVSVAVDGVSVRSDPGSLLEFSGAISGSGGFLVVGPGVVLLDGTAANTFTGATSVQHGTLKLNKSPGHDAIAADLVVGGSGIVQLLGNDQFGNSANIEVVTTIDLNGHSDTIGSLTVDGGVITNGGTLGLNGDITVLASGSIDATLNLGAATRTVAVNNSAALLQVIRQITGSAGLIKTGAGSLRFSGNTDNTYAGNTEVRGGTLQFNKTSALAINNSASLIIGNTSDGSATDIVRYLAGSQLPLSLNISIRRSGLLDLNNFTDSVGDIDMVGGAIETGTGTLQLRGNFTAVGENSGFIFVPAQVMGKLDLGTADRTFTVNDSAFLLGLLDDLIVEAAISGSAGIIKTGPGEMELNGVNTYTGSTTVSNGTLVVGNNSALGSSSPGTVVRNGARVRMSGGISIAGEPLTLDSTTSNPGVLFGTGPTNFWGGGIFLNRTSTIGVETNSILNLGGAITGPGGLEKEDDGELIFTGSSSNTYAGLTFIKGGSLFCNKTGFGNAIAGDVVVGDGLGGTNADVLFYSLFQLAPLAHVTVNSSGHYVPGSDIIGSLSGNGRVDILATGGLTTGGNNTSTTFNGVIGGGGALTKAGTGIFTLTANNAYTGPTAVQAGTLVVNGSQQGSDVTVAANATLAGVGAVGNLNVASVGHVSPGSSPGRFIARSTVFSNDSVLHIEINGPIAGTSYDQLRLFGSVTLTGSKLAPSLGFAPFEGEVFEIIDNNGTDTVIGSFDNLANGAVTNINGIPLRINYNDLTGNDVTLTVTNLPVRGSTATISTGNGDGRIDPNECNQLFLRVTNSSGVSLTNIQGVLTSVTPGVVITERVSAYPDLKTLGAAGTNLTAFQFFTTTNFLCGQSIEFLLTLTASNQSPFAVRYVIQSGTLTTAQSFTNNTGVAIPPSGATASAIGVSGISGGIARVTVSMALTHQNLTELQLLLIPPAGPAIPLVVGLPGTQLGTNCTNGRVSFDDDAGQPIEAGVSPYVGAFRPDAPLSLADGRSANGTWLLEIIDTVPNSSIGALSCWSLTITPATCLAGSGPCSICNGPFFDSITSSDPTMPTTLPSSGTASVCGVGDTCPGIIATPSHFDAYTFTNGGTATCVTVSLDSPCVASSSNGIGCAAYQNSFNPANPCANYLARLGDFVQSPRTFSFSVAAKAVFVVVVGGATNADCPDYSLRVDGFDCPVSLGFGRTSSGQLRIDWPTHASGFGLEWTTNLPSTNWVPLTNIPVTSGGEFVITNDITAPRGFYRLRKP